MRCRLSLIGILLVVGIADAAQCREVFLLRFSSFVTTQEACRPMLWGDRALLYNRTMVPATVRILGLSDGTPSLTQPAAFTLPPRRVVDLDTVLRGAWRPVEAAARSWLFVLHLDVPEGVTVDSRDEFYLLQGCFHPFAFVPMGHAALPVIDRLTPPGTPQVHLSTDLGVRESRTNVIIHNAGTLSATAHVELRRDCDDAVVDQRTLLIAPRSTTQVGGLTAGSNTPCDSSRHTVVTVDQPSFSIVSNVTISSPGSITGLTPTVDLSVARSQDY